MRKQNSNMSSSSSLQPGLILVLFCSAVVMTFIFIIEFWVLMEHFDGRLRDDKVAAVSEERESIDIMHNDQPALQSTNSNNNNNNNNVVVNTGITPYTTLTDPIPPLVLISRGCSGSSFIIKFAWTLLESHLNRKVHRTKRKGEAGTEYLSIRYNPRYDWDLAEQDPVKAGKEMVLNTYKDVVIDAEPTQIMAPKLISEQLDADGIAEGLMKLGAKIVMTYRRNKLGLTICRIRDCFVDEDVGVPVFENGSIAELCFTRRRHAETKTFAKINATLFDTKMRRRMQQYGCHNGLNGHGLQDILEDAFDFGAEEYPSLAEESLIAFEYEQEGSAAFQKSVESWKELLRGWDVIPQEALIVDEMRKAGIGSRSRSSTRRNLENHAEVEQVVQRWVTESSTSQTTCDWSWMLN